MEQIICENEPKNYLALNLSENMILEVSLTGRCDLRPELTNLQELAGKELVSWVTNDAVLKRLQQMGIDVSKRDHSADFEKRISLQVGDTLYVLSPLDGQKLINYKNGTLPVGVRFRVMKYYWVDKCAACENGGAC